MVEILMPYGVLGLFIFAFVEASFFPIPPYILFIPMTLAKPRMGLFYAFIGTVASVLGGIFGYILGYRLGRPLLVKIVKPEILKKVETIYRKYGDWATAVGGVTPLPYKIFAISAGVFRNRLATFIPASVIARGIRFFGEALLLMLYGEKITKFLDSAFGPMNLLILLGVIVLVILVWKMGWIPKWFVGLRYRFYKQWTALAAWMKLNFFPSWVVKWFLIGSILLAAAALAFYFEDIYERWF